MKTKILNLLSLAIFIMGLFSCSSQNKEQEVSKTILGMVLLNDTLGVDIAKTTSELKSKWNIDIKSIDSKDGTSILVIDNYQVAIATMNIQIPGNEIQETAKFNYLWKDGENEATKHKSHIIVSIMNAGQDPLKENILYTKLMSSILNNSNSLGVYLGDRTLLLKKEFYQDLTSGMSDDKLPIYNWVYIGIIKTDNKNSIYTYGLKNFNKLEMEIVESNHSVEEINDLMLDLVHYILLSNVTLNDGETIGLTEEQKLAISISKGKMLDDKTIKIDF